MRSSSNKNLWEGSNNRKLWEILITKNGENSINKKLWEILLTKNCENSINKKMVRSSINKKLWESMFEWGCKNKEGGPIALDSYVTEWLTWQDISYGDAWMKVCMSGKQGYMAKYE